MKNRKELLTEILDDVHNGDGGQELKDGLYVAVDSTVYAVLEYIDDIVNQFGHYEVLGKVLNTLRSNVKQFAGSGE